MSNPQEHLSNLEKILLTDEGLKLKPYLDSKGLWTLGIGRMIGQTLNEMRITEHLAYVMLREDIGTAVRAAVSVFGKDRYNSWLSARRDAILSLLFNMGEGNEVRGFRSFAKMIAAIKSEDWEGAAMELADSKWARDVDPKERVAKGRDDRIIYMLRTGEYHEEYNCTPMPNC